MNVLIGLILMFVFGFMPWCLCRASADADQRMEEIWRTMGEKQTKKCNECQNNLYFMLFSMLQ